MEIESWAVTEDVPAPGTALNTGISEEFYILYSQGFVMEYTMNDLNVDPTFSVASGQNKFINDPKTKGILMKDILCSINI